MKLPKEALLELKELYQELGVDLSEEQLENEGEDLLRLCAMSRGITFR